MNIRFTLQHMCCRYAKTHGKYTEEELDVKLTHRTPEDWMDRTVLTAVKMVRFGFDQGEKCCQCSCCHRLLNILYIIIVTHFIIILTHYIRKSLDGIAAQSRKIKSSSALSSLRQLRPYPEWLPPLSITSALSATWHKMGVCLTCS